MIRSVFVYIFVIVINFELCQSRNYTKYALYNLYPTERYQMDFLQNLEKFKYINVIFWTRPYRLNTHIQVLVNPNDLQIFHERLAHYSLQGDLLSSDIQKLFDSQKIYSYTSMKLETFSWNAYHSLESIYQWMTDLATQYRDQLNMTAIGKSAEGREILAIQFHNPNAKANVIVEGGLHGNEWLSTEFVTYLIYNVVNSDVSGNAKLTHIVKKFRWTMIPVANPDGYVYSMKVDRLWNKNRRNLGNGSIGVDLNKNFGYKFCVHGGSTDPNDQYYCGPSAFSEPETQAISKFVQNSRYRLNYYFSFHSYGQAVLIPFSDRVQHLENFAEMDNYGKQAILKIYKKYGTKYSIGTVYDVYGYRSAGDSVSWAKNAYKVKYALAFYLRDGGKYGYALPAKEILPSCEEMLMGVVEVMTARHRHVARELFSSAEAISSTFISLVILMVLCLMN